MDQHTTQETVKQLDWAWNLLQDPRLLFVLAVYGIGVGLKAFPSIPNDKIPVILTLLGPALGILLFPEVGVKQAAFIGFGATVVCVYFNQLLVKTFPNSKAAAVLAGEFSIFASKQPTDPVKPESPK